MPHSHEVNRVVLLRYRQVKRVLEGEARQQVFDVIVVQWRCFRIEYQPLGNEGVSNCSIQNASRDLGYCLRSLAWEEIIMLFRIGKGFLPHHLHA
jgi:hypothetical protein